MSVLNRREFLRTAAISTAVFTAGCKKTVVSKDKSKPNLLFVFTDQQSRDMLGCYGNEQLITPNLDSFAHQSIKFSHCVSSQPVCTPYRGMLMTGKHPLYNGCFSNDIQLLDTKGNSFGEVLAKSGYATGYFGKWHLYGGDRDRPIPAGKHRHGFEVFKSNNCHLNYLPGECFYFNEKGEKIFFDQWEPYAQTRQACDFFDNNADKPFAAFVSWHPPHDVENDDAAQKYVGGATQELLDLYDPAKIELRPNVKDTPLVRRNYHGYMAMISGIDKSFKMLIDKLKELNLYDNTIIVFTSDHGDMLSSNNRISPKSCPETEAVGVPMLVKLPNSTRAGTQTNLLVGSMDIMPTILSLMHIEPPKDIHGLDLSGDILAGVEDSVESVPLMYFAPAFRGVYTRRYTYARGSVWAPPSATETQKSANVLYDRELDPYEQHNRYDDPAYSEIRDRLETLSRQWIEKFGDEFWDGGVVLKKLMDTEKTGFFADGDDGIMTKPNTMPIEILKEDK
jgi:arylsulfatase A-like enzyme